MAFRVKDLMISIIPEEGHEPDPLDCVETMLCGANSHTGLYQYALHGGVPHAVCNAWSHHPTYPLCDNTMYCPPASHHPTVTWFCCQHRSRAPGLVPVRFAGDPALAAEQLATLKAQLKEAIAEIEAQEKLVAERLEPRTAPEIDALLAKLKEAQAELEKKKRNLEKR
jgi:hypothetical protein